MPSLFFFIKIRSTLFKVDFNLYNKYMKTTETPLNCHRIVSVDFFRGLAILGVVLTHCLIYGVFYSTANALATVPIHRTAGSFIADRFDFADGRTFCIHQRHREHLHSSAPFRKRFFGQKRHSTAIIDVNRPDCLSFRIFAFTEKFQCLDV